MIKLFRKLRQKLISEGRTEKYLKYAIGEIILVVIGILIAIQINIWNGNVKSNKLSDEYLNRIYVELKRDNDFLKNRIELTKNLSNYGRIGIEFANNRQVDSVK